MGEKEGGVGKRAIRKNTATVKLGILCSAFGPGVHQMNRGGTRREYKVCLEDSDDGDVKWEPLTPFHKANAMIVREGKKKPSTKSSCRTPGAK